MIGSIVNAAYSQHKLINALREFTAGLACHDSMKAM
jgi:hypothetical protein